MGAPGAASSPSGHGDGLTPPDKTQVVLQDEISLTGAVTDTIPIRARIKNVLPAGQAVPAGTPDPFSQVVVRGQAQLSPTDLPNVKRAVIEWTGAERTDVARKATFPSPLKSQFSSGANKISPGNAVTAQGDIPGAMAAIKSLFDNSANQAGGGVGKNDQGAKTPAADGGTGGGAGGGAQGNKPLFTGGTGMLAGTGNLPSIAGAAPAAADIAGTTTEGCPPRVDLPGDAVYIQNRPTKNGTAEGSCADTGETQALQKSFSGCADKVDLAGNSVQRQFRRYWLDNGSTVYVDAECQPDPNSAAALLTTAAGCTVQVNMTALTATQLVRKVYTDGRGIEITVQACAAVPGSAEGVTVPVTKDTSACGLRHDFTGGVSYEQARGVYTIGNQPVSATACEDTGRSFAHAKDLGVCDVITDFNSMQAFQQARIKISIDGQDSWVTNCTPDTGTAQALQKTPQGCEGTFFHNVVANQSFGAARWFHSLTKQPVFVSLCQQDAAVLYPHIEETTGYQNDDALKISRPLTRVHFNAPVVGDVEVSGPTVRPGAPEIPYKLTQSIVAATGTISYQGCDKFEDQAHFDVWERADKSLNKVQGAAAAALGPVNACTNVVTWAGLKSGGYSCHETGPCADPSLGNVVISGSCSYDGTNKKTREDDTVVSTTTNTCTPSSSSSTCRWSGVCPTCGGTIDAGSANDCRSTWGWW